ncbi:MAG: hypothetical protein JXQ29_18435 [Planctomycetes bacterium]|nr:hypothetical protein [Planctomycetota bacterium]
MKRIKERLGGLFSGKPKVFAVAAPFTAIERRPVADICRESALQEEARPYLRGDSTAETFLEQLVRADLRVDAVRFLAYALPEREAVRWACLCVREVPACCAAPTSVEALVAAETWVERPDPACRDAALEAGRRQEFQGPAAAAAWAAMAAGWSGGISAAAAGEAPAVPTGGLSAHAAAGAILLAASADLDGAARACREFLELGVRIAQGRDRAPP